MFHRGRVVTSKEINSKDFSFDIREIDVGKSKKAFVAKRNAATFFALKHVQYNIRRLYKVKQANRHQIVCQLRELLGDKIPKYIFRTDISSFYESIPRKKLLRKIKDDPLLTLASKKIIRRILFEYGAITGSDIGLPRGIGISAYLAEFYMRDIDRSIRDYPSVLYYARYVDDIFIILCKPTNIETRYFERTVFKAFVTKLKNLGLQRNKSKTNIIKSPPNSPASVQYLGYKFSIGSIPTELHMTDTKINRYKQRIDLTFSAYNNKAKKSKKNEIKARILLEKRIRFLTGNTRLMNNKKNVVSGIFFSNSLLTNLSDLKVLDVYLAGKRSGLKIRRLRDRLAKYTFKKGFETRKYHKFSANDLNKIVEAWRNVP